MLGQFGSKNTNIIISPEIQQIKKKTQIQFIFLQQFN